MATPSAAVRPSVQLSPRMPQRSSANSAAISKISFPSGTVLSLADVDLRSEALRDADSLRAKCGAMNPTAVAFLRDGSRTEIEVMCGIRGSKPQGPAIFYHPSHMVGATRPKQYVTYRNGKWDGTVASWDEAGRREFWGNYSGGQRNGLCCLIGNDTLTAVLECSANKVDAVHLITDNRVTKTLSDIGEARADAEAGPLLQQIDEIERELKEADRSLCDRVKRGVQARLGAINSQKRAANSARSAARAASQQQGFSNALKAAGAAK